MSESKILVAEEYSFLRDIIVESLRQVGECETTSSLDEFASLCRSSDCKCVAVVSANILHSDSDIDILFDIKRELGFRIVMLSSDNTSVSRINFLRKGADDVMNKPFNPEELKLRIVRFM